MASFRAVLQIIIRSWTSSLCMLFQMVFWQADCMLESLKFPLESSHNQTLQNILEADRDRTSMSWHSLAKWFLVIIYCLLDSHRSNTCMIRTIQFWNWYLQSHPISVFAYWALIIWTMEVPQISRRNVQALLTTAGLLYVAVGTWCW